MRFTGMQCCSNYKLISYSIVAVIGRQKGWTVGRKKYAVEDGNKEVGAIVPR